jgi:hypothetical protein
MADLFTCSEGKVYTDFWRKPMKELIESHIDEFISHQRLKGYTKKVIQRKERELYSFARFIEKPFGSVTCEDIVRYLNESPFPASFNRKL